MGLSLGSIIFGAVKFGASVYKMVKGDDKPANLVDALPLALPQILGSVQSAIKMQGFTTAEQIDSWIGTADALTGSDPGALDLVPGLPADKEEELFDAVLQAVKVVAYHKAGVAGYVQS